MRQLLCVLICVTTIGISSGVSDSTLPSCPMPTCRDRCPPPPMGETQWSTFIATGYAIGHPYADITKSGEPVLNKGFLVIGGLDIFTVAVDPKVIPMGSILWIDGIGIGIATDTGMKIHGCQIDICFENMYTAMAFGTRHVSVTILQKGDDICSSSSSN